MDAKACLILLAAFAIRAYGADEPGYPKSNPASSPAELKMPEIQWPDYPKFFSSSSPECSAADAEEAKADFSIFCESDGKLNIGIGPVGDGAHYPITFTFDELRLFWKKQRHKSFIVVTLAKGYGGADGRKLVARITEYFFECGLNRVRIHQASGRGVGLWSDSTKRSKTDERPSR